MKKEEKIIIKKGMIIESLKRCLERKVYSQISLECVAKEAGLSKGGLRHYFPTREELYIALIEDFFNQIQRDHIEIMKGIDLDRDDKAFLSTLFGIEKFLMDKSNIKILINIILYGFEDDKIMEIIRKFVRYHLNLYQGIIRDYKSSQEENSRENEFSARITQIILLCAGLIESIDPISMKPPDLIEFLLHLYKD